MNKTEQMIANLDKRLTKLTAEYNDLHAKLDPFRGRPLNEEDVKPVDKILKDIQDKFEEIYPAVYWIANRYEYAGNITNSHEQFIAQLIQGGAHEVQQERK